MEYTISKVAELLKINEETVRRWCRNGKIIAHKDSKKQGYVISENDLQEFVNRNPKYATLFEVSLEPSEDIDDMFCSLTELIRRRDELNERMRKIQELLKGAP